jgi:hypothetical protein
VHQVLVVFKVFRESKEHRVPQDYQQRQAHKVLLVFQVLKV